MIDEPVASRVIVGRRGAHLAAFMRVLRGYMTAERAARGFPDPWDLAMSARIHVHQCPLPTGFTELTDGEVVLLATCPNQRELGTRLFRALASVLIEHGQGAHTIADVHIMAARLAAPPLLMKRVGINETVRRQTWATERMLRTWWDATAVKL